MPKKKGNYTQKMLNVYENYQMLTWLLSGWKSPEEGGLVGPCGLVGLGKSSDETGCKE